jgi:hypothetical protein
MAWETAILLLFEFACRNPTPLSFEFHGVYNTMMWSLFRADLMLCVTPHFVTPNNSTFWFEVMSLSQCCGPVFFLEIGCPSDLDSIEKREKADLRTRDRMAELVGAY